MTQASRADHLHELAQLLWPAPLRWELTRGRRRDRDAAFQAFVIIPSARTPWMLVPTSPRLAASALRNSQSGSGSRERLRARGLATAFRLRVAPLAFRDRLLVFPCDGADPRDAETSLKAEIDSLTQVDGYWALHITRPRANRKPVLQVLSKSARPIAFVKVGTNELTKALVRAEGRSLVRLYGALSTARIPSVIGRTDWRGLTLLLLSPLPLGRRSSSAPPERAARTALEIMRVDGTSIQPLRGSDYWGGLRDRLAGLSGGRSSELLRSWHRLDEHVGAVELEFCSWHGDWAPWNMAWVEAEMLVWDLERFEPGVPAGFDFLHMDLQTRILDPSRSAEATILSRLDEASSLLEPAGVAATSSSVVFAAYLLEIACRWLGDRQAEAGGWGTVLDDIVRSVEHASIRACAEHAADKESRR